VSPINNGDASEFIPSVEWLGLGLRIEGGKGKRGILRKMGDVIAGVTFLILGFLLAIASFIFRYIFMRWSTKRDVRKALEEFVSTYKRKKEEEDIDGILTSLSDVKHIMIIVANTPGILTNRHISEAMQIAEEAEDILVKRRESLMNAPNDEALMERLVERAEECTSKLGKK